MAIASWAKVVPSFSRSCTDSFPRCPLRRYPSNTFLKFGTCSESCCETQWSFELRRTPNPLWFGAPRQIITVWLFPIIGFSEDYFKNGIWQNDLMRLDIEVIDAHRREASIIKFPSFPGGCVDGGLEFLPSKLKLTCLRGFRLERAVLGIAASVSGNVLSCYCSVAALKVCRNCAESKKRHVCSSWCQWNSAFSPQCSTGAGDTSQFLRWCIAWGQTRPQWRRSISHLSLVILRQGWNDRCCFCLKVKVQKSTLWPCGVLGFLNSPRVILTISPTKSSLPLPPLKHPLHLRLYNEKDMDMCSLLQATSLGGLIRLKRWRLAAFRWSVFAAEFFNARSWAFALPH